MSTQRRREFFIVVVFNNLLHYATRFNEKKFPIDCFDSSMKKKTNSLVNKIKYRSTCQILLVVVLLGVVFLFIIKRFED